MEAFTFNTAELILLSVAGVLFIIQVIYYLGLYNRIHSHNKAVRKEEIHFTQLFPVPVTVGRHGLAHSRYFVGQHIAHDNIVRLAINTLGGGEDGVVIVRPKLAVGLRLEIGIRGETVFRLIVEHVLARYTGYSCGEEQRIDDRMFHGRMFRMSG